MIVITRLDAGPHSNAMSAARAVIFDDCDVPDQQLLDCRVTFNVFCEKNKLTARMRVHFHCTRAFADYNTVTELCGISASRGVEKPLPMHWRTLGQSHTLCMEVCIATDGHITWTRGLSDEQILMSKRSPVVWPFTRWIAVLHCNDTGPVSCTDHVHECEWMNVYE